MTISIGGPVSYSRECAQGSRERGPGTSARSGHEPVRPIPKRPTISKCCPNCGGPVVKSEDVCKYCHEAVD